jgi:protein-S-isoprenylcysteine O-methyltransferase Ste14
MNLVTLAVIAGAVVCFAMRASHIPWTPARAAGISIALPALLLLVLARIQLGRAFSVQAKATTLVTTGLYSRIRNPIYIFGALMIAGVVIWTGKLWFLLIFALVIPMQVIRSRKEEQVLAEKFGPAYLEYKQKTWF